MPPMISYVSGRAIDVDTVLVGGVGYCVHTPVPLVTGQDVTLWVHTVVRETEISLYGFDTQAQRALFVCLMKVTSVGPRVALALMSVGAGALAAAIVGKDAKVLAKAPGVGIRKAETILAGVKVPAELLSELSDGALTEPVAPVGDDLLVALVGLGHEEGRASSALAQARRDVPDGPQPLVLRAALRLLASPVLPAAS